MYTYDRVYIYITYTYYRIIHMYPYICAYIHTYMHTCIHAYMHKLHHNAFHCITVHYIYI